MTRKSDPVKGLQILAVVTPVVLALVIGLIVMTWRDANTGAVGTRELRRQSEIQACRSIYATDASIAEGLADAADARLDAALFLGLQALVREDDDALAFLVDTTGALVEELEVRTDEWHVALDRQREMGRLSRTDPAEFLRRCREDLG